MKPEGVVLGVPVPVEVLLVLELEALVDRELVKESDMGNHFESELARQLRLQYSTTPCNNSPQARISLAKTPIRIPQPAATTSPNEFPVSQQDTECSRPSRALQPMILNE